MNCVEFESILADYIDGTLSPVERAGVEQHAGGCSSCREFMAEVTSGLGFVRQANKVEPPPELITRLAYLAPTQRTRAPFEQQGLLAKLVDKWLRPLLQPRLAMGMAMTILSFAMLKRCTGVQIQQIQPADLNPIRILGGVEDKALRVKDQVVKYYDNLRVVYEIETHLRDLEESGDSSNRGPVRTLKQTPSNATPKSGGTRRSPNQGEKP